MFCYLIRHGADDNTVRGGWSQAPLTEEGILQVEQLSNEIANNLKIEKIYTSDLKRAFQTAQIIGNRLSLPLTLTPQFRETNNGDLAGMDNDLALKRYPGLFWNQLKWEQCYPNGESPKQFYERVASAWEKFSQQIQKNDMDVILVTHGGVIQVILSIINNERYSNTAKHRTIPHASIISITNSNGLWQERRNI